MKTLLISVLIALSVSLPAQSQESTLRFCRFDNLNASPDGGKLAFDCYYFEENALEKPLHLVIQVDFSSKQMVCLNPPPNRFVVSTDKKYVLFSSMIGLYLFPLAQPENCVQLKFLNPAADLIIRDMGFAEMGATIYWTMADRWGENSQEHYLKIPKFADTNPKEIQQTELENLPKAEFEKYNLKADGPETSRLRQIKLNQNVELSFQNEPGQRMDLLSAFMKNVKTGTQERLLTNFRVRLVSQNPKKNGILFSTWDEKNQGQTWFVNDAQQFSSLAPRDFRFVSWLSNQEFIGLANQSLYKVLTSGEPEKLNQWPYPTWYRPVQNSAYTVNHEVRLGRTGKLALIQNSGERFVRSQIVIQDEQTGTTEVLVPAMSNVAE